MRFELSLPATRSLKEKRGALRPVVEGLRRLASFSVAEVDHHDRWRRAGLGVAVVTTTQRELEKMMQRVERYLDSRPEVDVIQILISYLDSPEHPSVPKKARWEPSTATEPPVEMGKPSNPHLFQHAPRE